MKLLPYAQLLRLPNVFTALADICLGGLVTGLAWTHPAAFALLLAASACLYSGGMVWNDWFDRTEDARERPFRPLPSGRVPGRSAFALGIGLLAGGFLSAAAVGWTGTAFRPTPAILAGLLVAAILLYDAWLKHTPAGPVSMATCRFLNVLLGLSGPDDSAIPWTARFHLALVVGLYIVGVTWFARREAQVSRPATLRAAAGVMLASLLLALVLPIYFPKGRIDKLFPYLLVGFGFLVGVPVRRAIGRPTPAFVQAAVKGAIFGLVALDAVLATALAGVGGLVILLLLPPTMLLGKWVYST